MDNKREMVIKELDNSSCFPLLLSVVLEYFQSIGTRFWFHGKRIGACPDKVYFYGKYKKYLIQ